MQCSVLPTVNNLGFLFYVTALQKMKTDHPSSSSMRGGPDKLQTHSSSTPISSKGKAAQKHYEDRSHCLATAAGTHLLPSHLWTTLLFLLHVSKTHSTYTGIIILQRVCACAGDSLSLILVVWKCTFAHIHNPGVAGEQCAATPQNMPCASDRGLWWDMSAAWHLTQPTPSLFPQDYRSVHPLSWAMCILAVREVFLVMWWQRHCKVTQKVTGPDKLVRHAKPCLKVTGWTLNWEYCVIFLRQLTWMKIHETY